MNSPSSHRAPQPPSAAPWDHSGVSSAGNGPEEPAEPGTRGGQGFWAGRSGLVVPLVLAAVSTYLVYGIVTMEVPESTDFPGPRFYPLLLAVAGYALAALLVLEVLRKPQHLDEDDPPHRWHSDWSAVAWLGGGFLAFAVGIEFLGWILAGALLFWCVARGVGSRRPLFDLSLALVFSSLIYLAFAVGLGLNLPSGLLGGL